MTPTPLTHHFFDSALLKKYNINGPRYTSYPTALEFHDGVDDTLLAKASADSQATGLSLYIHIPFCHSLCYYCGCNKIVTRHPEKADKYLDYLAREIAYRAPHFAHLPVQQIHLGGGTPSFLSDEQQSRLIAMLKQHFRFVEAPEMSIEIDPRTVDLAYLDTLAALGFNRLSIGLQDTDYGVQEAINRVQSTQHIADLANYARDIGFRSVNLDLIYGLPHQTLSSFSTTLAAVKAISPERISLFSYAHLPSRFAAQRKIRDEWLPTAEDKLALMKLAMTSLTQVGYDLIGMDHFAKPDDELAVAQRKGYLHRNFQGYTTQGDLDLLALGVSSISAVNNVYAQNPKTLNDYYSAIDAKQNITVKGAVLDKDDMIRRDVIQTLMCNLHLDMKAIEQTYQICFTDYFAEDLARLAPYIQDQLVTVSNNSIQVAPKARLLIRMICMAFDAYLAQNLNQQRYSRVI